MDDETDRELEDMKVLYAARFDALGYALQAIRDELMGVKPNYKRVTKDHDDAMNRITEAIDEIDPPPQISG